MSTKNKCTEGFSNKYCVDKLVHFEQHQSIDSAINREKQVKKWNRAWKIKLIEKENPSWDDLYLEIL